jgi:nitrite reductase/ring-hydroxylating ferredoxin subunit
VRVARDPPLIGGFDDALRAECSFKGAIFDQSTGNILSVDKDGRVMRWAVGVSCDLLAVTSSMITLKGDPWFPRTDVTGN